MQKQWSGCGMAFKKHQEGKRQAVILKEVKEKHSPSVGQPGRARSQY